MKNRLIFILLLAAHVVSAQNNKDTKAIAAIIQQQQEAWNKADLEGFMQPYWHSDSLTFIGKSGVKRGWQTTLDNYKKSYPNAEVMGTLQFTLISVEQLSENAIFVVGKWALTRKSGDAGGHFTLLWKKINGNWVIVTDHSS